MTNKILKHKRLSSEEVMQVLQQDKIKVYLAGPISFAEDFQDYRKELTDSLKKLSSKFEVYDPWLYEQKMVGFVPSSRWSSQGLSNEEKKSLAEEVIENDLKAVASADLLIAYVFKVSAGTSMEIFYMSRILRKPVIILYVPTEESELPPLWLYGHANLIFQSKKSLYSWLRKEIEDEAHV